MGGQPPALYGSSESDLNCFHITMVHGWIEALYIGTDDQLNSI